MIGVRGKPLNRRTHGLSFCEHITSGIIGIGGHIALRIHGTLDPEPVVKVVL